MKNTGGVRKIRWAVGNKGKSGSARMIYYWHNPNSQDDEIYLLFAVSKNEQEKLSSQQKSELKNLIESEYHEQDNE